MYRDKTSTQTTPMQYAEVGTNTNMVSNRFAQTQPMQYSEAGTNTNIPCNNFSQNTTKTQTISKNTESNHISNHSQ